MQQLAQSDWSPDAVQDYPRLFSISPYQGSVDDCMSHLQLRFWSYGDSSSGLFQQVQLSERDATSVAENQVRTEKAVIMRLLDMVREGLKRISMKRMKLQ